MHQHFPILTIPALVLVLGACADVHEPDPVAADDGLELTDDDDASSEGGETGGTEAGETGDEEQPEPPSKPFEVTSTFYAPGALPDLVIVKAVGPDDTIVAELRFSNYLEGEGIQGEADFGYQLGWRGKRESLYTGNSEIYEMGDPLPDGELVERLAAIRVHLDPDLQGHECVSGFIDWMSTREGGDAERLACDCAKWFSSAHPGMTIGLCDL